MCAHVVYATSACMCVCATIFYIYAYFLKNYMNMQMQMLPELHLQFVYCIVSGIYFFVRIPFYCFLFSSFFCAVSSFDM